ncbi:MAG: DUF3696 domain-containing protein [Ferruginibacter sp.]
MSSSNKLDGIGFENFRIFKNRTDMEFRDITVLTGTNSSGKSSVINGIRLIKENYCSLKFSEIASEFELDSIFDKQFEVGEIIRRYGNLQNFISFKSEKNEFTFSLQEKMRMIDDTVIMDFTVQIQDNTLKNGKLIRLEMKSKSTGIIFFSINERKDIRDFVGDLKSGSTIQQSYEYHQTRINLWFFFENYFKWISTHTDIIEKKDLEEAENSIMTGKFYDFLVLWSGDVKQEELFSRMVKKVYGDYNIESLIKLQTGILKYLSKVHWRYSVIEMDIDEKKYKGGLGYLYFDKAQDFIYVNKTKSGLSLHDYSYRFEDELNNSIQTENKLKLMAETVDSIKSEEELIKYLAILLRNKSYIPTKSEKYFYNEFIFHNLNLIKKIFQPFVNTEFVSADRANSERAKSLLDKYDISRLTLKLISLDKDKREIINAFLIKWLVEFGIAEDVFFTKNDNSEIFEIFLNKNNQNIFLADMGFGVSQLLPIILSCYSENKIVAVEEPETNLHPALQSKLADFFIDAAEQFNIQFIIETHSEYLIRKLQYLTAKTDSNLKPEHTVIYYFYHPDQVPVGEDQVKKIYINDDGSLTDDFGSGFFDEADNIALELFLLNKSQSN